MEVNFIRQNSILIGPMLSRAPVPDHRPKGNAASVAPVREGAGEGQVLQHGASLSVSIVTHAPNLQLLASTLHSLARALDHARCTGVIDAAQVLIVDNGPGSEWSGTLVEQAAAFERGVSEANGQVISGHGNLGYGAGHNLAIGRSCTTYHLVLNPDVRLAEDAIAQAVRFLDVHREVGLLAPAVWGCEGERQFLCKRYPSVTDLLVRGFVPRFLRGAFRARLERYEMRDVLASETVLGVPLVSGCFMLLRLDVLRKVGGFSPDYHLYFEDFDLSLRIAEHATIAYVPSVRIMHYGGFAARKGWRHVWMFARAGFAFFQRHGWKWR
jgi:GT2 family glycosyltransferase